VRARDKKGQRVKANEKSNNQRTGRRAVNKAGRSRNRNR
jgi:hypothetical protein